MCTMASKKFQHDLTEFEKFEYKWTLHNFSSCNVGKTEAIRSRIFISNCESNFKNILWQMKLFPNGNLEENKEYISLFLQSLSVEDNDFKIPLCWEIIASNELKVFKEIELNHVFEKENSDWGYPKFINKRELLNDLKKGNDMLTIICKMSFSSKLLQKVSQLNILKDFGSLLEMKKNCDIILISNDGIEHNVHKAILSCRSIVFSAMFEHDMKEKLENVVKIEDVNSHTLKNILHFVYTAEIKNVETNFQELFIAADKYAIDDLKNICTDHLNENINNDNILDLFQFAQCHNISNTKLKTAQYFLENKEQVMSIKGLTSLKNLSRDTLEIIAYISATNDTSVLLDNN